VALIADKVIRTRQKQVLSLLMTRQFKTILDLTPDAKRLLNAVRKWQDLSAAGFLTNGVVRGNSYVLI
jgi:hypothetical protein